MTTTELLDRIDELADHYGVQDLDGFRADVGGLAVRFAEDRVDASALLAEAAP